MLYSIMFLAAGDAGEKTDIGTALLNTIMSIAIVFVMLIIISLVISLLKYVPKLFEKNKPLPEPAVTPAVPVVSVTEPEEEEELSDDLALVAVITAAIYAYEESQGIEVPADGLVVKSIKKANKTRWQNA